MTKIRFSWLSSCTPCPVESEKVSQVSRAHHLTSYSTGSASSSPLFWAPLAPRGGRRLASCWVDVFAGRVLAGAVLLRAGRAGFAGGEAGAPAAASKALMRLVLMFSLGSQVGS